MNDGIIAATGNSRKIYGSLPSTYAEFKAAVEAGNQGLDILFNAAGWSQQPTFLTKATLLNDVVASKYNLTSDDPTVSQALFAAYNLITTAQNTASGRALIARGSYTGTGTFGESSPNTLTAASETGATFTPKFLYIQDNRANYTRLLLAIPGTSSSHYNGFSIYSASSGNYDQPARITRQIPVWATSNVVSWYCPQSEAYQLNESGVTYRYIAIG